MFLFFYTEISNDTFFHYIISSFDGFFFTFTFYESIASKVIPNS